MRKGKLVVAALAAMLIMAIGVGSASASRGFSPSASTFGATARALSFTGSNGVRVICDVTLGGSLHSTIAKTPGTLGGFITSGRVAEERCTAAGGAERGRATILQEGLPWHVTYNSFTGTLPSAVSGILVTVNNASFLLRVRVFFVEINCLYRGSIGAIIEGRGNNSFERITVQLPNSIPVIAGQSEVCPPRGELNGFFTLTAPISITLV